METSKMKNMIVLRNLPSNLVEEAIVIFKEKQKVKNVNFLEKNKNFMGSDSKDYILKEAEMLVNEYMKSVEEKKQLKTTNKNIYIKYNKLKKYSIFATIVLFVSLIFNII